MSMVNRRRFTSHNYANASLLKRLAAMVYDALLVFAVWMLVGYIAVAFNSGEEAKNPWFSSVIFIITYGFFALFWLRSGQTLGMVAWRLRVEDRDGYLLSPKQSLWRFMGACVSLVLLGAGFLWILVDKNKLAWHDYWSASRIVQLPKVPKQ